MKKRGWRFLPAAVMGAGFLAGFFTILLQAGRGREKSAWRPGREIMVVTRESGSGTRSAFLDLFDLWEEQEGRRTVLLTEEAVTVNRSGSLLAAIAGNPYAIGYASLQDHLPGVKAIAIDQVTPTREHIQDGSYSYIRPFFIAVRREAPEGQAFLQYVLSEEGQRLAEEARYFRVRTENASTEAKPGGESRQENSFQMMQIEVDSQPEKEEAGKTGKGEKNRKEKNKSERNEEGRSEGKENKENKERGKWNQEIWGKLVFAGSSTVMPLAEIWAKGFQERHPAQGEIELQESDSSSGMTLLLQGNADVAFLSRELTREERQQVIWAAVAMDGMVILVNEQNPVESLTKEEIRRIFMGADQIWTE